MARFLRSKRSQSIGVMLFDVTDPFCTPILRGIENGLYPLGYLPIFADAHNQRERFERYLEMLLERHVDGLIVVANWLFVDIHVLADLNKQEIPTATIGWELPGDRVSSVMVDNEAGGRLASSISTSAVTVVSPSSVVRSASSTASHAGAAFRNSHNRPSLSSIPA
jgi:LacI family transcriptional regulator